MEGAPLTEFSEVFAEAKGAIVTDPSDKKYFRGLNGAGGDMALRFCQGEGASTFTSVERLSAHVEEYALVKERLDVSGHPAPFTPPPGKQLDGGSGVGVLPPPGAPAGARPGGGAPPTAGRGRPRRKAVGEWWTRSDGCLA